MSRVAALEQGGRLAQSALVLGIVLAALTEAIAGTVLSLGRADIIGDTYATPDEFAWLDVGYTTAKLIGFVAAPLLLERIDARRLVAAATLAMGIACAAAVPTTRLELLVALRVVQGLAGGALLVAGQVLLFAAYARSSQPLLQALFALGSVVAPATIAPALQGWLLDHKTWSWIFFSVVPVAMLASGLLIAGSRPVQTATAGRRLDRLGLLLIVVTLFCASYVLSQGSRWDWFGQPRIVWLTAIGAVAAFLFVAQQIAAGPRALLDLACFRSDDFTFAFVVSFVAGAALFGSAYVIPSFAVSLLAFPPTDAGLLLLPSGALFAGSLFVAALVMQVWRVPPIATVPFGILMVMAAMWMLSGSTSESGAADMTPALLLRGFGLGFLFLSITLVAFADLGDRVRAYGIGLFDLGRQIGGLIGVAGLQTLIDHQVAGNLVVIGSHVSTSLVAVNDRLGAITALLAARGMETAAASRAAVGLLNRAVATQATVIAFDTAFVSVALLFVVAAPLLIMVKITLTVAAKLRASRVPKSRLKEIVYAD
ncbi:MFS transporter [Rhodopseudomonas sp. HC1]|uniref:MFS transporter n=1 Tax=Rhodopseudomonas infernalis TaxID=2897386 RepID=UPI001EE85705|nr:MFS transporter [Rhodopseudomonas infernalis]MCG6205804.1 MFS transporter [Rhodopseudomonas infernalis]